MSTLPTWPALLVAPSLTLLQLSANYALVTPACTRRDLTILHGVAALALIGTLLCTFMAIANWRRMLARSALPDDASPVQPLFLARIATIVGLLFALVSLALWLPQWIVSPCQS